MTALPLRSLRFRRGQWRPVDPAPAAPPARLRLVTLNTWFAHHDRPARLAAQLSTLARLSPDIIALQEVTADLLQRLLRAGWLRESYAVPGPPDLPLAALGYGTLLAVRPACRSFSWRPFAGSVMGRGLLSTTLAGGPRVGTVHLESMADYAAARAEQLAACTKWLTGDHSALLMGDFNFDDDEPDAPSLSPWTDLWPVVHPHDPGFTVDSTHNAYRSLRGQVRRRIDRVVLHDPTHTWRVTDLQRIGTEPVAPGVHLSDHFGLVADLSRISAAS